MRQLLFYVVYKLKTAIAKGSDVRRFLTTLLLGSMLATASWAQDADPDEGTEVEETQVEADEVAEAEDVDDSDLDEQTYSDADDDFRPSEDIPADQSIAFPTDI